MRVTILYAKPKMRFPIGSWLIRLVEGTKGSHIALGVNLKGAQAVFESVVPRSRIVSRNRWDEHYEFLEYWYLEFPEVTEAQALGWILRNTDKEYSRWQCVLLGLGDLCGGWVQRLVRKQNPNGSDYLICVEAVVRFLEDIGGWKFPQSPDVIGIDDFLKYMRVK